MAKKMLVVLGALAVIALAGCEVGSTDSAAYLPKTNGKLTVTNIPANYIGKFAFFSSSGSPQIVGGELVNAKTGKAVAIVVDPDSTAEPKAGKAEGAVYTLGANGHFAGYSGTESVSITCYVVESSDPYSDPVDTVNLPSVSFIAGRGTVVLP